MLFLLDDFEQSFQPPQPLFDAVADNRSRVGEKANCVAVEDSPNGLKSASLAGMVTVMIPDRISPNEETEKVTDYLFDSLNGIILARW